MDTKKDSAKYPLVNGRYEFDNGGYVEVTNGNHVELMSRNTMSFVNLSNIFQNSTSISNTLNIDRLPSIYIIPDGVDARIEIKNVQCQGTFSVATNFRIANSTRSGSFSTGPATQNNPQYRNVIEKILDQNEDVGCYFVYSNTPIIKPVQFDVEFTVNGERWI